MSITHCFLVPKWYDAYGLPGNTINFLNYRKPSDAIDRIRFSKCARILYDSSPLRNWNHAPVIMKFFNPQHSPDLVPSDSTPSILWNIWKTNTFRMTPYWLMSCSPDCGSSLWSSTRDLHNRKSVYLWMETMPKRVNQFANFPISPFTENRANL